MQLYPATTSAIHQPAKADVDACGFSFKFNQFNHPYEFEYAHTYRYFHSSNRH